MLTVKAPIECKAHSPIRETYDDFHTSIMGNYGLMNSRINSEELLHMVSTPPEVYIGEGGSTSILSNTSITQNHRDNLEIINNLINKIVISGDVNLTYRDRVYITNALNKLGIRDERKFMSQVMKLQQETREMNELIDVYWNYAGEIKSLIQEYREGDIHREETHVEETSQEVQVDLYRQIFDRLQTALIYQEVNSFQTQAIDAPILNRYQVNLSEQGSFTKQMLLTRLKELTRDEKVPLVYRQENTFEDNAIEENVYGDTTLEESLTSAVLLNIVDKVYKLKQEDRRVGPLEFYETRNTLYGSSENTLSRFKTSVENFVQGNTNITVNRFSGASLYKTELTLLNNIMNSVYEEEAIEGAGELLVQDREREILRREFESLTTVRQSEIAGRAPEMPPVQRELLQDIRNDTNITGDISGDEIHRESHEHKSSQIINRFEENFRQLQNVLNSTGIINEQTVEELPKMPSRASVEEPVLMGETPGERGQEEPLQSEPVPAPGTPPRDREQVMSFIREYLEAPANFAEAENLNNLMAGRLAADLELAQGDGDPSESIHVDNITEIRENVTQVLERWNESSAPTGGRNIRQVSETVSSVDMVHKTEVTGVDEELLQELITRNTTTRKEDVRNEQRQEISTHNTSTVLNNTETKTVIDNRREIEELVRKSVQRQMSSISDRVYSRLERQLDTERRRRGF